MSETTPEYHLITLREFIVGNKILATSSSIRARVNCSRASVKLHLSCTIVALGRASRMAATMSGRLFLVSESDPQHLLGAGVVFAEVVVGVLVFPFHLEELTVEVVASLAS